MKTGQRSLTEKPGFLFLSLPVAFLTPVIAAIIMLVHIKADGRVMFQIGSAAAILSLMAVALFEFETDGLFAWVLGGGAQSPRFGLGFILGMSMKGVAILHSVAALVLGSLLVIESDNLPARFSSWPSGMGMALRLALIVWLWVVTVWAYLAGDGWIRRWRRAENPDGAGLE